MDTSETYIKMCEGAPELELPKRLLSGRRTVPWLDGDMIALNGEVSMYDSCSHSEGFIEPEVYDPACIWLPRQDQLQEMIGIQDVRELLLAFHRFTHPADGMHIRQEDFEEVKTKTKYRSLFTSMEQLWFAFMMKQNHNKVWDGSSWTYT